MLEIMLVGNDHSVGSYWLVGSASTIDLPFPPKINLLSTALNPSHDPLSSMKNGLDIE